MRPNIVFVLADQLRAASLPVYGETQIRTPAIDSLASRGTTFTNMMSTCPVCTPYRSMLLTGRHPQTTGHLINFVRTRHDEIGIGDAFGHAGYRTAWVGKWHLHTGCFPEIMGRDHVPRGRDRLGFEHWRGYNFHMKYFDGWVSADDWRCETWEGYETDALGSYALRFLEEESDAPFCLFVSPHQPHGSPQRLAPEAYYERVPAVPVLPPNVPPELVEASTKAYRDYLAMTLAVDDLLGRLLEYLHRTGKDRNTLVVFTSDHGSEMGAHGSRPWDKMRPHFESLRVPLIACLPGVLPAGAGNDALIAPVDLFPTLCGLCELPVPRSVEGHDLSAAFRGEAGAFHQESLLTMNFTATFNHLETGKEWRGLVTRSAAYARWLDGRVELHDRQADPYQLRNLAGDPAYRELVVSCEDRMLRHLEHRGDQLGPCTELSSWFDANRRVIRNAYGPLGDPESEPDWSLLGR